MLRKSAGLLLFREIRGALEVFLVHPGGPFWAHRDDGVWSIPKGEFGPDEEPLQAARREFEEETGASVNGEFQPLLPLQTRSGKEIQAWALRANFDATQVRSNTFRLEWPPKSGCCRDFPEIDRARWFTLAEAKLKIVPAQAPLLDQLKVLIATAPP